MKFSPLILMGSFAFVGCQGPSLEGTKSGFQMLTMGGSLDEEAMVDPQGQEPGAPADLAGEPDAVPAPAKPLYINMPPELRDVSSASAYVFESKWHSIPVWLYPDGVYATKNPQRISGAWKEVHRVLTLEPEHGGRMIFGPDAKGNYVPQDSGVIRMRKVQHNP